MNGSIHKSGDLVGDRYRVRRYIGEGGMQEVYEADDLLLSRLVAMKAPKNPSAAKRFQRSAIVSARVNHANVAKTLDYLEEKERSYLIEEYIDGKDLGHVLKERIPVLDPLMAAQIFHHLAKGIAASHHAGVVHRDLKPSNIMAVGGEKLLGIKITDFGIAKMAEEELADAIEGGQSSVTASQTAIGALPYMAPEMIESFKDAGKPADVWSLGALVFEIVSGTKPFGVGYRAVPNILAAKFASLPPVVTAKVQFAPAANEIYSIIKKCLQRMPSDRPSADQLVRDCEQLCYPIVKREFGVVSRFDNNYWGFIVPDHGKGVFFHVASIFGSQKLRVGDRVWFARHAGGGSDRAFPVLRIVA